jgi:alkylation response protein AidB-like acyl-CoA dehydrogenase
MWDLLPNDDERMIAEAVREYLAAELPIERLRPNARPVDPARVWQGMADLGWFDRELGLVAEMLIQRECGRFLASPSVLATVLAGHIGAARGTKAALAIDADPEREGAVRSVLAFDWNGSDPLLFWNNEDMGLFDADALGEVASEVCFDESLTLHRGRLEIGQTQSSLTLRGQVLLSAALVGLAGHACDLAVEYAKVREQFGKPIGNFQAIKHRCADMAVRQRLAWYQTCLAALKLAAGAADAELQVASAKLLAAEAAHENGRACVQIHGGIGFQAECDAHWFLKRARVYDQVGGAMAEQARRIIAAPVPAW